MARFPVVVDGQYYSEGERCSHCGRPRPKRFRRWSTKRGRAEDVNPLCRKCQRIHMEKGKPGSFVRNENCPACRETGMVEEYTLGLHSI